MFLHKQVISIRIVLKLLEMLITKLTLSKYKMNNFAIFLNDLLPFVCEIMLLILNICPVSTFIVSLWFVFLLFS